MMRRLARLFSAIQADITLDSAENSGDLIRTPCENKTYIWSKKGWPTFTWDNDALAVLLARVSREQGRSSIARQLGMDVTGLVSSDRNIDRTVEIMLDAIGNYTAPLTEDRLFGCHAALFPTGRSGMHKILVGQWRNDSGGPMQVVSGATGRQKVHYEALPADRLPQKMAGFLAWFNAPGDLDPLVVACLAHLYVVSVHPFDDGNGRIARAIADMALARADGSARRTQERPRRWAKYQLLTGVEKSITNPSGAFGVH